MATINYSGKAWKDYPDTSTPILAADLNNIEGAIEKIGNKYSVPLELQRAITAFALQLSGGTCNTIYDEYQCSLFSGIKVPKADYNPANGDVLITWVDNVPYVLNQDYTITLNETDGVYEFTATTAFFIKPVTVQVWNLPQSNSGAISQAFAVTAGEMESEIGTTTILEETEEA